MAGRVSRYAVLTPFEQAEVVAGVCKLAGFDVEVLPSESGAVVVRELEAPTYDEWDIRNITGPDDSEIGRAEAAGSAESGAGVAAHLSRLSRYGVILFEVALADGEGFEEGVSGEVKAHRFLAGKRGAEIPASLLLNAMDTRIEGFLLGELDLDKEENLVRAANISAGDLARMAFRRKPKDQAETADPEDLEDEDEENEL